MTLRCRCGILRSSDDGAGTADSWFFFPGTAGPIERYPITSSVEWERAVSAMEVEWIPVAAIASVGQ